MKILPALSYILRAISYGLLTAVVLLILVPELRDGNSVSFNIFKPDTQKSDPMSFATAVAKAAPAVVNIYSETIERGNYYQNTPRKQVKLGSGVIMDPRGYILTNYHVVMNADMIRVVLQDNTRLTAELIGSDQITDLAVLKVAADNLPVIPRDDSLTPLVGDVVLAIGNPLNIGQTVTQGIISATGRNGLSSTNYREFLQMDAAINDGNSGGALVNSNGDLVGITSAQFKRLSPQVNIQGIFFAVPYKLAAKVMRELIENGQVIRGWLGVSSDSYNHHLKGFVVNQITPGGPAEAAGLAINDVVHKIGGQEINSINHALDIIAETNPGAQLEFTIYRENKLITIPVIIGEFKR
ncbi:MULTISPECIES: trypsin-like peptidase domain-containing protein [unclassified Thalassotalea]|uniref:trypsin-like peptidase domain-containing protein n=1 Tax=unclassified Thalassotalea TaxID=2614972 RepID=UPI00108147C8|nr:MULTISPECIES: trypsin-like peptidase domain-containing protein [unclassified Thalassotalea]NMP15738.1 PDZ domain-containing protein [Thalassotalea sp. Y01]QBY04791.1 PDZ domain-containing protein [Thalassotalea sp. HSM 43]